MTTPEANPYDRIPYESKSFPQSHPRHLAALAKLFGLKPPEVEGARILELGCASGGNILPIAAQMPGTTVLGLDLSQRQIAEGQRAIADLGLANAELRVMDLADVDATLGKFDYVIAHGVFSWVPEPLQERVLDICSANLAPNGVAYISYNTYPGWRMRGMLRDAMLYHARQFADTTQQVRQARALIDFLAQNVPTENNPFGILLKQELEDMRQRDDYYLAHEHLEGVNEPVYFHQFAERAAQHGLQYLGEAEFNTMLASNFPRSVADTLRVIAPDVIRMEQYMDFLRNRPFRQTLLVHGSERLNRNLNFQSVAGLYVDSSARPEEPGADLNSTQTARFRSPNGVTLATPNPLTKAAMTILSEIWPQSVRIEDLGARARGRLAPNTVGGRDAGAGTTDMQILGADMLQCFAAGIVNLRAAPFNFTLEPGTHPRVSALARWQAAHSPHVTNARHEPLTLDEFNRQLVQLLDGQHNREGIVDALARLVENGTLTIRREGGIVSEPAAVRETIGQAVDSNMQQLVRVAMLEA